MSIKISLALFALAGALCLELGTPAAALDNDCDGTPSGAVMTLPAPLSKWGRVSCTPFGHVLASHEGWAWVQPDGSQTVLVPSQRVANPRPVGNSSYFTKIEMKRITGEEFAEAYHVFHDGLDDKEPLPDGYRVDLETASGKSLRMYFFDYDTYAWAIECGDNDCDPHSRFAILDKEHRPQLRQPSI
ncbi:MAG TPA: hypothetical protein VEU06_09830 [Micropepsaceae bacterium]|nr:hypothetical protein [Micropepsaceae bacterium]